MPCSFPSVGTIASGRLLFPLRPKIRAPISESGRSTRPIGRRVSDASPLNTERNGCGARSPIMSRSVVPEFPASSTDMGSDSPCRPLPVTISSFSLRNLTSTPSARITPTVERQSAAWRKFRICTGVFPSPANMTLRCEMDLSPGISTVPRQPCSAGSIVRISAIHSPSKFHTL